MQELWLCYFECDLAASYITQEDCWWKATSKNRRNKNKFHLYFDLLNVRLLNSDFPQKQYCISVIWLVILWASYYECYSFSYYILSNVWWTISIFLHFWGDFHSNNYLEVDISVLIVLSLLLLSSHSVRLWKYVSTATVLIRWVISILLLLWLYLFIIIFFHHW